MTEPLYFAEWPASLLRLTGADRAKILHNLSTANIEKQSPGSANELFVTNAKGHVVAHVVACCQEDSIALVLLAAEATAVAAHFEKYIFREDARVVVEEVVPLLLVGSDAGRQEATGFSMSLATETWVDLSGDIARAQSRGYTAGSAEQFDSVRVANCWPLAGIDFGEGTLPQELDRNELAISFTKGCYLGQETIARLDALGHVNKQIVRVVGEPGMELEVGTELQRDDKVVGQITTVALLEEGPAGLAMVRSGSNDSGTRLMCGSGELIVEHRA